MSAQLIQPPQALHDCRDQLPWSSGGYGSTGHPDGTLARCDCGRWWHSGGGYASLGPVSEWLPVRWYHRALRRRIEATA